MASTSSRLLPPQMRLFAQLCSRGQSLPYSPRALSTISQGRSSSRYFSTQPPRRSQSTDAHPMQKFTYHAAASFSGKGKRLDPNSNVFQFNPYNRVQPQIKRPKSKRPASGQDAFFIARMGDTNAVAFGVADGVGGWEESGVDPADFSHSFCDYMALAAYESKPDDAKRLTAKALMQKGYDDVCHDKSIPAGGSTACVAIVSEDGVMDAANLGDSGFVHLRLNGVHHSSEAQTHAFNTPYQLSIIPPSMLARAAAFGGAQLCDYPKDADVTAHELRHGDVLVFASDGLWDNLFDQDVLRIASRVMTSSGAWKATDGGIRVVDDLSAYVQAQDSAPKTATLQSAIALDILATAKRASMDQRLDGPFAKEVQKYYPGEDWHGGKVDDICIIVVIVSEDGKPQAIKAKL
ncbi:phosphatase 2C-like domain-containing protein [Apiospora arundinis]|uniref:Protein phosphatase n=1 Tax=Apiospora arundinis TaxID=335852 RepID=A0ABR2J7N2_9PEZI